MIWQRDRYIAHCNFEFTGREMFCELFGPLVGLDNEWRKQGATEDEINMIAFDWDYVLKTQSLGNFGAISGIEEKILEDTPDYTLSIDKLGRTMKLIKASATIPLPLNNPVETMEDWLKIKHWYAFKEERVDKEWLKTQRVLWEKGYLSMIFVPGAFDELRELMGEENLCIACYEEPELLVDILNTIMEMNIKVIERIAEIIPIDCVSIHEDMAGKSGPLFGPNQVREFMNPYYSAIWQAAKSAGAKIFSQDSDGNINAIIDTFLESSGVTCFYPCEPAAGMDIVQLRKHYGKQFHVKGGIDKHALRGTKEDIRKELEYKICEHTLGGGTIFALDHRIPNGVSLENYKYYVNLGREMLGIEPISGKGWERMAF